MIGPSASAGESIGDRVRRLRDEQGLSQRELALETGLSNSYLSRIEKGERAPSIRALRKLARRLAVSAEYLETGVELSSREELELALADADLRIRLDPFDEGIAGDLATLIERAELEGQGDIAAKAQAAGGRAAAAAGRLGEAIERLEAALQHPLMRPEVVPDAYVTLIDAYHHSGRPDLAAVVCEQALAVVHDEERAVRALLTTHLSYALSDLGEIEQAEQLLEELEGDSDHVDPYARARLHWSLARAATMQDQRRLALRHMRHAIGLLEGTEDSERLARAHLLCAQILLWGGRHAAAGNQLRIARALLPEYVDARARGNLKALEALLLARQGAHKEARIAADEAIALIPEAKLDQAPALYAKALAAEASGNLALAEVAYDPLVTMLVGAKLWREASSVATDRAQGHRRAGDDQAATEWEQRAATFASSADELQRVRTQPQPKH